MEVDYITDKIYIVDRAIGTLSVTDFDGKNHAVILSDIDDPRDMVMDVKEGVIFILLNGNSFANSVRF